MCIQIVNFYTELTCFEAYLGLLRHFGPAIQKLPAMINRIFT